MLKSVRYLDAETMVKSAAVDDSGAAHSSELVNAITEAQGIDASSSSSTPRAVHLLHMRLMQRPQMSTMSLPISATWPSDATPPLTAPWLFIPDVLAYSRFMMATPEYMLSELQRELGELQGEWDLLAGDELGRSFVTAAREKVDRQVGKVCNELMTPMVRRTEADSRAAWAECVGRRKREEQRRLEREARNKERELQKEKEATEGKDDGTEVPVEFLAASGHQYTGPTVHVPPNLVVEPNPMPPKRNRRRPAPAPATPPSPPSTAYYFYQSSLGANVFLNPLDSRMLLAQFESYAACPPRITFPTTGYDTATVTDDLRRRVKYLSHLPVGTEVVFVEADLSRIVSRDVLAQFEQPLRARRDKRRKRARREDRDKRRAEEAERARRPDDSNTYVVPSALAFADDDDTELARALAASRLGTDTTFPLPSEAGPGMFGTSPTSPTSPSAMLAHSPTAGGSFAWAVHSRAVSSRRGERVAEGVNEAWSGVLDDHEEEPEDTTAGRKKKGGKKGKKLVLGGGGGRRA
jgi:hypothetical protein